MTLRNSIFALLAGLGLATGCAGELMPMDPATDDGGGTDVIPAPGTATPAAIAKATFEAKVAPKLEAKCATACHAGAGLSPLKFLGQAEDRAEYYVSVTGYATSVLGNYDEATAQLITKVNGGHYGPWGADEAGIKEWFAAERTALAAPNPGTTNPGTDPGTTNPTSPSAISKQLVNEWAGCMNLQEWDASGVATAWANKRANNNGNTPCQSCHINGGYNFIASNDSPFVFNMMTDDGVNGAMSAYYMESYFVPSLRNEQGVNDPKMIINRTRFTMVGTNQAPHTTHPSFNPDDGDAMTRLQAFYDQTMARKAAGTCGPPKLIIK